MAREEIYNYVSIHGYDNVSGGDRELYDLYRQLDSYEAHSCLSGLDFPEIALILSVGAVCGFLIRKLY